MAKILLPIFLVLLARHQGGYAAPAPENEDEKYFTSGKERPTFEYNGVYYTVEKTKRTWSEAEEYCQKQHSSGHLVTIPSANFYKKFRQELKNNNVRNAWIGISDKGHPNEWKWTNPEAAACTKFTIWRQGNPIESQCAMLYLDLVSSAGPWLTVYCLAKRVFVCEFKATAAQLACEDKPDTNVANPDTNPHVAHYKPWGSWGRCTEPCDGGEQTRYRECKGPKELCTHRIEKEDRKCNVAACRFKKRTVEGVKYYETDDGMCLSDFSKEECEKIAKGLKVKHPEIVNKDRYFFPHGCYHSVKHDFVFYNEKPSTKRCDKDRRCICRIALGKEQLIDWVFGDEAVNPGQSKSRDTDEQYRREMEEERYVSDAVKKRQLVPGENLYELMKEM